MAKSIKLSDNNYIDSSGVYDVSAHTDLNSLVSSKYMVGFFSPSVMNFSNNPPSSFGRCIIPITYQYNYANRITEQADYYMLYLTYNGKVYHGYSEGNARVGGNWDITWTQV